MKNCKNTESAQHTHKGDVEGMGRRLFLCEPRVKVVLDADAQPHEDRDARVFVAVDGKLGRVL